MPYSVAEKARAGLLKVVDFTGEQSANLLQLSLLVPVIIWLFSWLVNLFQPGSNWAVVGTLHLILLFGMIWGFLSRKDDIALVFPGVFWMHTFVRTFSGLSSYSWSYYLAQALVFFFVAYCACGILAATPLRKQPLFKRACPIIRLVTTVLVSLATVLGLVFFLLNIKSNYYDFSSLVTLLGSTMLLFILSGDFKDERWMKTVRKFGPLLFFSLLIFFGLFDGLLSLVVLKGSSTSSLQLLCRPLLMNLFTASFILPANFIAGQHLGKVGTKSLDKAKAEQEPAEIHVEDILPLTEEQVVEPSLDADVFTETPLSVDERQSLHFVEPEYQVPQEEPAAWQNPLIESVDAPSAWQPLPFDLESIGTFKADLQSAEQKQEPSFAAVAEASSPLSTVENAPVSPIPARVDQHIAENPFSSTSPASQLPTGDSTMPSLRPQRIGEVGAVSSNETTSSNEITSAPVRPVVAPRRVDLQALKSEDEAVSTAASSPADPSVLSAETKVLPRLTEADLATARSPFFNPEEPSASAKPQIRRVDTEM